jgi:hypothetical protein
VALDKAAVDREAARLAQENADLRQLLANFLNGISVNSAVLANPANPLLVVNSKLQQSIAAKQKHSQQRASGGRAAPGALGVAGLGLGAPPASPKQQVVTVAAVSHA